MNTSDQNRSERNAAEEAALNEYLRRDSALSQRYRELGAADVPPSLDHAVMARAQAAVAGKRVSRWRGVTRWSGPLALAASIVVVVSIVREPAMQNELATPAVPSAAPAPQVESKARQKAVGAPAADSTAEVKNEVMRADRAPEQSQEQSQERSPEQSPTQPSVMIMPQKELAFTPAPPVYAPSESVLEKKSADLDRRLRDEAVSSARQQVEARTVSMPPPSPAVPPDVAPTTAIGSATNRAASEEIQVTAQRRASESQVALSAVSEIVTSATPSPSGAGVGPRGTIPAPQAAADTGADKEYSEDDAGQWLDRIRQLRAEGKVRRADAEWRSFRKKYPDFNVDENDTARPKP